MTFPAYYSTAPVEQITQAFRKIEQNQMQGLPVCNEQLTTEIIGLTRFDAYWVGALITPWTLQLIMLPATAAAESLEEGDHRTYEFPQGSVVFMTTENTDLGPYQSCALMSPLHSFETQEQIRQTAAEVMELMFQPPAEAEQTHSVQVAMPGRLDIEREAKSTEPKSGTRRDFLRGALK
ncbi:MAG: [NiFe]-hydrogenase assembly chaperone HybE [Sedimenticola sp.]|nr:[NiFe]-hydrogenase assembly chaperone HybE [Sedimenticola sp.]